MGFEPILPTCLEPAGSFHDGDGAGAATTGPTPKVRLGQHAVLPLPGAHPSTQHSALDPALDSAIHPGLHPLQRLDAEEA